MKQLQDFQVPHFNKTLLGIFLLAFGFSISLDAKANTLTGEISGSVFVDENINGINDETSVNSFENITSVSAVLVYAYDETGAVADRTFANAIGNYTLKQLNPNETYRIEFRNGNDIISSTAAVETITAKVGTEKASQVNYAVVKNTSIDGQDSEKTVSTASNKTEIFNQLHIKSSFSYDAFINYANISAANEYFTSTRSDNVQSLAAGIWNNEGRVPFQTTDNQVAQGTPIPATARVFASALTEKSVNARSSFSTSENAAAVGAAFVVLGSDVSEACFCLANATSTEPGQFVNILSVTTDTPGESWQIISASGIQQGLTSPGVEADLNAYEIGEPVMTVPFDIGGETESLFEETTNGESIYSFAGVTLDGAAFSVEVTNGSDTVLIEGASCNYNDQIIQGQTGVCASSVTSYCVEDNLGSTYEWNVSGGGVIMTSADEACIEVLWDPAAGGPYTVSVIQTNENLCLNPASIDVNVGVPGGAMACIAKANISLSVDCDLEVTPDLVLETPITGDQVYTVIVTDPDGNMLPEPIITSEYVGLEMEVKIMDVCSGNSCWTTITVFDKMKPTVDAQDITIACSVDPDLPYPLGIDNCDSNPTVELISETIEPLTCDDNFTTEITRVFIATDSEGNVSAPTEQVIYLERINLDSIVFPVDRTVIDGNPVFCQQFDLDDEGNPAPSTAGVPTYRGQSLYPYQDQFCSFGIDYNDLIVEGNSCVTKIMRTWTAYEWWCGESIIETVIQEINIADQLDPEFEVPADIVVTTNVAECFATVDLPAIIPTDDCSSTFEIDIQYPGGFLNNSNGGAVDFELGVNEVIYTVYDGCLNSVSQSFTVTVEDNTMPVMVCDGNTVISLNANGTAYAPASVFNDGTIEDCTDLTFEVLRMDNGSACGELEFQFGEFVNFCCADVGQVVQVILKATDENNNSNTCVVDVVVQDKNAPVITVPADLTIECTAEYDPENLEITFGTASATDNCLNTTITEVSSINISDCNTGTIVRTFTASDGNGEAVDTQTITVVNSAVFDLTDIIWPLDYTTDESCNVDGLQPEDLQAPFNLPILTPDACDMIDLGFQDQTFTTSDDACFKIIRTWMVMDMCNLQQDGSPTMFMHDQTIVVTNSVDPIIVTSCDSISSSLNADCDEGFISLTSSATDDCTAEENIRQSYFIDVFNDGSFEEIETGNGGTILVEGVYPLGTHRIVYEFEDRCGNSATCTQMFTIFNEIPPLAKCQDLAVELTPADTDGDNILDAEQAFLDVELVGGESEAACGGTYTLSYNVEGDSTIAMFDCFNLGTNIVTVYVTDDLSGLQSSCTATVIVQDNNDVEICPSPEDCIVWPDTNLLVDFCVTDLQPESILSETEILEPCVCGDFDVTFTDVDLSSAGDACAEIERTWLVTFNCFVLPLEYTFVQTITQLNAFAPVITSCPDTTFAMSIDGSCFAPVTIGTPAFDSSCSFGVTITNDSDFSNSSSGSASGSYPVGVTEVTYTLTDECGNASVCNVVVVVNDSGAPICNTQDITISIPTVDGSVTIEDDAVDDNSVDDCGTIVSYSTAPNTFSCNELGENTVVMTVTDNSGNSSTCTATVTVVDEVAPICNAGSLTLTLFTDTTVSITGEELDNGSEDLCGTIASYEAVPNVFSCADVGENDVVLIVTDNNGNTSSCVGTVTILDEVAPLCESMDATIILDANGNYTLDASEVDGGSMDVCGDQVSLSVMPDFFTCDNLGDNIVTLTVTDLAGNTSECTATVTVTETIAPICSAGTANITLFSNTTVTIPASFVDNGSMDECGVIVSRTITPNMFGCSDIGMNSVILTVTDDSGNSSTCEGFVNVSDNIAPICEVQDITVMIGADGLAIVDPLDIDNGSSDECGEIVSYTVEPDTFTCVDEGINTVVFTVTDNSGNTCTSSANVTVESMDSLLCVSQDITVFLDENGEVEISPEDVDGGSMAPCGSTVTLSIDINTFFCDDSQQNPNPVLLTVTDDITGETDTCTALVTVLDTLSPVVSCPADLTFTCDDDLTDPAIFGEVLFEDNCPGSLMQDTIVIDERNTCGIGIITRRYIAVDLSGNVDSCEQVITIEVGENAFTEDSITWPMTPFEVVDCSSTDPLDLMSFPILDTMNLSCFNISVDFEDESIGMGTMCMDTIERTWTVIDSCQLDGTGTGIFTFLQTLYIDDSSSPVILGLNADTLVFTSLTSCDAFVDLSAAEAEDCTMNLEVSNNSPFADDQNSLDASGTYPLGTTEFSLFATDACGNTDTLNYAVTVEDNVNPVVDCIKVFTDITANGTVTVFPEEFIGAMSDNCTDSVDLEVSFILDWVEGDDDLSDNPLPSSITFDCDQIGISVVFVVFIDESGNFSVCGAQVAVSDPNDFCDGGTPAGLVVDGTVNTINGQPVEGTIMSIEGTSDYETSVSSDGLYAFPSVPLFASGNISAYNNENMLFGVTTLDLLLIQNHIMNLNTITSPYYLIAADVDHSEYISGNDLITLQKLILGEITEIDNNTSFRFVDSNYEFLDNTNPFITNFPEKVEFTNLSSAIAQNFVGIKVGDVNGSYVSQSGNDGPNQVNIHSRSFHTLTLETNEVNSVDGFVEIPIYSGNFESLQALEMTINSDNRMVEIIPGAIEIKESEYRTSQFGRKLKVSWVNNAPVDVRSGDIIFTIVVKSNVDLVPSDVITLSPSVNEFYNNVYDIAQLRFANEANEVHQAKAVLNQNAPNPWSNETMISFEMVQDGDYTLSFFDIDGKLLTQISGYANKGYNEVQVSKREMGILSGVIVYEFTSGNRKLVKRMVLME